jgi:hypothetical protein
MKQYRQKVASLIFFSFVFSLYSSFLTAIGFGAGTFVHTPSGTIAIENLKQDDTIWAFDLTTNSYVPKTIEAYIIKSVPSAVEITTNDSTIIVEENQKLYSDNQWIEAKNIDQTKFLFTSPLENSPIKSITKIDKRTTVFDISVADLHNFFICPRPILVHNFIIEAGITIAFGKGIAVIWTGGLSLFGIAAFAGYNACKQGSRTELKVNCEDAIHNFAYQNFGPKHSQPSYLEAQNQEQNENYSKNSNQNSSGAPDPDDDPNKKDRKKNEIHKSQAFENKEIKNNYQYNKQDNAQVQKNKGKGPLKGKAKYLTWDSLHNEIEAFDKGRRHLGALDPITLKLCKGPKPGRTL